MVFFNKIDGGMMALYSIYDQTFFYFEELCMLAVADSFDDVVQSRS